MKVIIFWGTSLSFIALAAVLEGGHLGSMIQGTAGFAVFGPVLTFLIYYFGFKGFFRFWKRVFTDSLKPEDASAIDKVCIVAMLSGTVGTILGMIHVMENLSDTSRLGAGVAVAFMSGLYGLLPALLLMPLRLERSKTRASSIRLINMKVVGLYGAFICMMLIGSFFIVLYAASPSST